MRSVDSPRQKSDCIRPALLAALLVLSAATVRTADEYPVNYVAATLVQLNDNGAWSWFMDPRVIVNDGFDNLRPVIPKWNDRRTAIAWMRGPYVHNHGEWYSAVVAAIVPPRH